MNLTFYLNDELIEIENARADQTVLDFLRENQRLKGTKEGCREGDCGACTVLIGRVQNGALNYVSLNACIAFLPQLHRAHLVTIEALSQGGKLHWVQKALIEHHGTQCGFCTPGIVMSLYAAWMNSAHPKGANLSWQDWQTALQGNLCRCTGYASILRAMTETTPGDKESDPLITHRQDMQNRLEALPKDMLTSQSDAPFFIPQSRAELEAVSALHPDATLIAGATDIGLWVTKAFRNISPAIFLHQVEELNAIQINDQIIEIGALTTIENAQTTLAETFPELKEFWPLFAGPQIRHHATIGGSIANGSPIGDIAPIFLALDAQIRLNHGGETREIPLDQFFIAYGQQDIKAGEFVETLILPRAHTRLQIYKISKRPEEDISAVLAAIALDVQDHKIRKARLAFGGMAATPKRAINAEKALENQAFTEEIIRQAMQAITEDFQPISDMRASKEYRLTVAQNALLRAFHERAEFDESAA